MLNFVEKLHPIEYLLKMRFFTIKMSTFASTKNTHYYIYDSFF